MVAFKTAGVLDGAQVERRVAPLEPRAVAAGLRTRGWQGRRGVSARARMERASNAHGRQHVTMLARVRQGREMTCGTTRCSTYWEWLARGRVKRPGGEIRSWTGGRRVPAGRGPSPTFETPEVLTLLSSGRARRDSAHLPDERWTLGVGKGQPQASVGNLAGRDTPLSLSEVGKREPHASCSRCLGQQGRTRPASRERGYSIGTF